MNPDSLDSPLIRRLVSLADDQDRDRVFVGDLVQALEERAMVALILLFALPNAVPVPPGTSAILGAPLLFLTLEWALGVAPWLPRLLARRSIARTDFAAMVRRARPWIARIGHLPEPRLHALLGPLATRLVAALCMVLALIILLPIPFGNMPPAWSISLIALGMLRRDGAWVLLGIATGLVSIALVWVVSHSLASGALGTLHSTLAA